MIPRAERPRRPGPVPAPVRCFAPPVAALIALLVALGCGDVRGYEVAEQPPASFAVAPDPAPTASDTVPTIVRAGSRPAYDCARLVRGARSELRGDTLIVQQAAGQPSSPYCIPYNLPVRTAGMEATARLYPAEPHGALPGANGWRAPEL